MRVKTKLWKHQQDLHDYAVARFNADPVTVGHGWEAVQVPAGFAFWVAGCATGKTLAAFKLVETMGFKKVLVLTTKAAATSAWLKEARKHLEDVEIHAPVDLDVKGKKSLLSGIQSEKTVFYVVNYESSWRMEKELAKFGFDFVIADEGHKLQSHNSKQSILAAKFCEKIPYKLDMTGTGWEDRPTMVYGQVRWFAPKGRGSKILGTWTGFFNRYVSHVMWNNIPIIKGYIRQDELRAIMSKFTVYVDSDEVLDLPEEVHIEHTIKMPKKIQKAYDMMLEHMVSQDNSGNIDLLVDNPLEHSLRLHQITSGYLPDTEGNITPIVEAKDNPKLQETLSILDEIGGKPVVIFTRFKHDVELLRSSLGVAGYEVLQLTGEVQEHNEFQAGKGQILIANIQAGAAGIDLTRSRYCIYYSLGHSRTDYMQSIYRIRRDGADMAHPVTYYHLIMENSIDVTIRAAMQSKGDYASFLIQGLTRIGK